MGFTSNGFIQFKQEILSLSILLQLKDKLCLVVCQDLKPYYT